MPYLDDVGVLFLYYSYATWYSCLDIVSSTDLRTGNRLFDNLIFYRFMIVIAFRFGSILTTDIELMCQTSSGLVNLGVVNYQSYKTKCSEIDGELAIPTSKTIERSKKSGKFWTGIERTGPYPGTYQFCKFANIRSTENFTFVDNFLPSSCGLYGDVYTEKIPTFGSDVYAHPLGHLMPLVNESEASDLKYIFTLRNKPNNGLASCICVSR